MWDLMNKIRNVLIKKTHNNSAHCAYLTRPRRIKKEASWCGVCDVLPNILWQCYYPKKKVSSAKKRKKKYPAREISTVHISCLIHDSFVTRRLLYDFCESEYKKKVLCYCAVFLQIKKEAEKNCQNYYYKCCSKGGGLWGKWWIFKEIDYLLTFLCLFRLRCFKLKRSL